VTERREKSLQVREPEAGKATAIVIPSLQVKLASRCWGAGPLRQQGLMPTSLKAQAEVVEVAKQRSAVRARELLR
jgi:hypothetical protein